MNIHPRFQRPFFSPMKRYFLTILAVLALTVTGRAASPLFYNNDTITTPPVVDATNFLNEGRIMISTPLPFEFSSVLNYTNRGLMRNGYLDGFLVPGGLFFGSSGFRFDTAPATDSAPPRHPAASFFNAPQVGNVASNATIYGDYQVVVEATNIVNNGAIKVSEFGLISLAGKTVNNSRGTLATAGFGLRSPTIAEGIYDNYWFFGTNTLVPSQELTLNFPFTQTPYPVIFFPPPYFTNEIFLDLFTLGTNSLAAQEFINEAGTNRSVQVVFVRTSDPTITARIVSSGGTANRVGVPIIEWASYRTNLSGVVQSNLLYLTDTYGSLTTNRYITNYPYSPPPPAISQVPPRSFQPANFTISRTPPLNLSFANPGVPFTDKPVPFWGDPTTVTGAVYSAYGVTIRTTPTTAQDATTMRAAPGRVEVKADRVLDATLSQIDALSYLKLSATNHFVGASNAFIAAPFSDVALASTNGYLNVSSVLQPVVGRISGTLEIYSAVWTNNVVFNGSTNPVVFNALLVDAVLEDTTPAQIFDLSLKSTAVEVGDSLNVLGNLSLDTDRLNVTSNGIITINNSGILWETSVPHLKTLTNSGTLASANVFNFISHNSNGTTKPMDGVVNYGIIQGSGVTVTAHNLFNQGNITSLNGPLALRMSTNIDISLGGVLNAPEADINMFGKNLVISNATILAGRKLNLSITNQLLAGTNNWLVYEGFSLPVKPTNSDLSLVTIRSKEIALQSSEHLWSGSDRGAQDSGFNNNAALGMLVLDGDTNSSSFVFKGNGSASNALYVDRLELTNAAGLINGVGDLTQVQINPGMVVYYAQATINGASVAEFLDGKNGGKLRWVSSHAGAFSGTNVIYPDGSTNFLNAALVTSCNLDSDNDGIPNCIDPSPVLLLEQARLTAKVVNNPNPALSLSWLTVGWATNRVYTTTNMRAPNWQFLTNVVSPPQAGPPFLKELIVPLSSSRFYRVDVVVPPK